MIPLSRSGIAGVVACCVQIDQRHVPFVVIVVTFPLNILSLLLPFMLLLVVFFFVVSVI